jgi:hypothetical protein
MISLRELTHCDGCNTEDCESRNITSFCEDCKYYVSCDIKYVACDAGHEIECNNGFEPSNIFDDDEDDDPFASDYDDEDESCDDKDEGCQFGGDISDDCDGCSYFCDYHYDKGIGECVRRKRGKV